MSTLASVKASLRISHNALDNELTNDILAAEQRLRMMGVQVIEEEDALTLSAIELYCKGRHNYQGDGPRYDQAFDEVARAMALAREYNGSVCDV